MDVKTVSDRRAARRAESPKDGDNSARPPRGWAAIAGLVAAAVALGVGEFLAGLLSGVPSLVLSVGRGVIDVVPPTVKTIAISLFGTNDKLALIIGILVLSAAAGAGLGMLAQQRFDLAVVGFAAFGLLGITTGGLDPQASLGLVMVSAALSVAAGLGALWRLLDTVPANALASSKPGKGTDRRSFLQLGGIFVALAGATTIFGRFLGTRADVSAARADLVIPPPAETLPPPAAGTSLAVDGITPLFTPNSEYYRIDTALAVPMVLPAEWEMRITGMVDQELVFTYDELLAMPQFEADVTLCCVSNEVGGELIGNARWQGVRLDDLLNQAGVQDGATQIVGRSVDGWTAGFPTELAFDGRDAMVAFAMNGEPLPVEHGFPARLVVPGVYGYVSATKWLSEIELTTWEAFNGYWVPRGWAKLGPIKTQSRIDVPRNGATLASGTAVLAGVAWAQHRGVERVEVQIDEGPWQEATLAAALNVDTWRQWRFEYPNATPGTHRARVRATDAEGDVQGERPVPVAPDGAEGWDTTFFSVV